MKRGEIWWADLPEPLGAEPGYRRPVVIVSNDSYNQTLIQTVIVLMITSNLKYAKLSNNIFLSKEETGLNTDSVINITQLGTIDRGLLEQRLGSVNQVTLEQLNENLKTVLGLW
jgi:mRNA interferase MazF